MPGARKVASFLDSLPNVNDAGCVKQLVLNHSFNLDTADPLMDLVQPRV